MQIGTIAKKIGISVDAIRFYERNDLLAHPPRTSGGFRQYCQSDVETIEFIRRTQGLGFTLKEVRELLELRRNRLQPCGAVRQQLEEKLRGVRRRIADVESLEQELRLALRNCNEQIRRRPGRRPFLAGKRQTKRESTK